MRKTILSAIVSISVFAVISCSHTAVEQSPAEKGRDTVKKADYEVKTAGETVRIEVAGNGYTPKHIGIKKGVPVKLEFFRKDADNCGEELVFPTLNIKKDLPVGKSVVVEITPETTGEIKFACGMDMLRGSLIVSE